MKRLLSFILLSLMPALSMGAVPYVTGNVAIDENFSRLVSEVKKVQTNFYNELSTVTLSGDVVGLYSDTTVLDDSHAHAAKSLNGVIPSTSNATYPLSISGNATTATTATNNVLKAGDTMTGQLNVSSNIVAASSITANFVQGGGANFTLPVTGVSLSEIEDLTANKVFTMGNKTLEWQFVNPSGGMLWEFTGAAAGHSLEIMQSGGNPSTDMHLLHIMAADADPTMLHLVPGAVGSRALLIHTNGDTTSNPGRFELYGSGGMAWGTGAGAVDTTLSRTGIAALQTNATLTATGFVGPLTGNASTASSVPQSGVNLSTVTTAIASEASARIAADAAIGVTTATIYTALNSTASALTAETSARIAADNSLFASTASLNSLKYDKSGGLLTGSIYLNDGTGISFDNGGYITGDPFDLVFQASTMSFTQGGAEAVLVIAPQGITANLPASFDTIYSTSTCINGDCRTAWPSSFDNLGNHVATTSLNMAGFNIVSVDSISANQYYGNGLNLTNVVHPLDTGTFPFNISGTAFRSNTATVATWLGGENTNSIPYQTEHARTGYLSAGTSGYVLQTNGDTFGQAPTWTPAVSANTAGAIVRRDASGNFSAGTITAALSGSATSVPTSGVDLSTVTTALSGKLSNTATVPTTLIDLSTVTTALAGKLSNATTIPSTLIDLSTVTTALAGKLSTTSTVPANLINLSTVTTALAGKLSNTATVPTNLIDLSTVTTALAGKQATGNYITALTGNVTASGPGSVAATIVSVPTSAVNLSTVTTALAGKLSSSASVPANLIDLSTVTTALAGKLSSATSIPQNLVNLSTVTTALAGKLSTTASISPSLIDLSTVTTALAGKLSTTGNAVTASLAYSAVALSNEPVACPANQYATDISSMGVLTCSAIPAGGDMYLANNQTVTGLNTFTSSVTARVSNNPGITSTGYSKIGAANSASNGSITLGATANYQGILDYESGGGDLTIANSYDSDFGDIIFKTKTVVGGGYERLRIAGGGSITTAGAVTTTSTMTAYAVNASSVVSTPQLCLNGTCMTSITSGSTIISGDKHYEKSIHSGGDVFIASGTFIPNTGATYVVDSSTIIIDGVKCYTISGSTVGSTFFNLAISSDVGSTTGWNYMMSSSIEVSTNAKYSSWSVPSSQIVAYLPSAISLHTTKIPTSGTLPSEYGCTFRYYKTEETPEVSTATIVLGSGGDVYVSSGTFTANIGMSHTIQETTITITGVRCYTLLTSSVSATTFNIARSTDTGATTGYSYLFNTPISVSSATKYSAWATPDQNSTYAPPYAISLHTIGIPASGTLPSEYGCEIKYWRRLD